jgi:hypothetical protein
MTQSETVGEAEAYWKDELLGWLDTAEDNGTITEKVHNEVRAYLQVSLFRVIVW